MKLAVCQGRKLCRHFAVSQRWLPGADELLLHAAGDDLLTLANVGLHLAIGGGLALLLRSPWLCAARCLPHAADRPVAVPNYHGLIWKGMFNRQFGAIKRSSSCWALRLCLV